MNTKYVRIDLSDSNHGGRVYEKQIDKLLPSFVSVSYIFEDNFKLKRLSAFIFSLIKFRFFSNNEHILTFQTIPFINFKRKNILIIHHIDIVYPSIFMRLYYYWCFLLMYLYRNRIKQIIVVSEYWKNLLEKKGFTNIKLIYNSFNTNMYNCSKESVNNFKKKYNLITNKKIIYVGSIKEKKGYDLVYNSLKNEDYIFVGSGSDYCEINGIKCFNLSFKEYLLLISASDIVVLMSHFREGWNRIAHEAILLNKKVIGSGWGGMKELLESENRIICNDIQKLRQLVEIELNNDNQIENPIMVSEFDLNYFKSKWLEVLN